jgi:acyl carrier protein
MELLARLLHEDPEDLRRDLIDKGSAMPVDSLDLFDILVEFRQQTGLSIPKRKLGRQTMRSVQAFSRFVASEARP